MTKRKKFALEDLVRNAGRSWVNDNKPGARRQGSATQGGEGSGALSVVSEKPDNANEIPAGIQRQGSFQRRGTKAWKKKIKDGDI